VLRLSAPLLVLALSAGLTACSSSSADQQPVAKPEPSVSFTADVPVLVPGSPGEEPAVVAPGEQGSLPNADLYSDADVEFVTAMVPHHAQALEMAELAPERARDQRVKTMAGRIAAGQGPEIAVMQAWLASHGLPKADPDADHGHDAEGAEGMQGMVTGEQMTQLLASDGEQFDRLFLTRMIAHHAGALEMASRLGQGTHPLVMDMAKDVAATQTVEIARMQEVLADLEA
jgi:uncharacterized protein (DUF305 family)